MCLGVSGAVLLCARLNECIEVLVRDGLRNLENQLAYSGSVDVAWFTFAVV